MVDTQLLGKCFQRGDHRYKQCKDCVLHVLSQDGHVLVNILDVDHIEESFNEHGREAYKDITTVQFHRYYHKAIEVFQKAIATNG